MAGEELKAHRSGGKNQPGCILRPDKQFPAIEKYRAIKAGFRLGFFRGWLDLFGCLVVLGWNDKALPAGSASRPPAAVFVGKGNQLITVGTVKPDRHIITSRL